MNDRHRDILRRHWSTLRRDLEPVKLLPYLVNVLDVTDEQDVKLKATREDRTDKLLEILPRRGPTAFDDFVKALQEIQPFLAAHLLQDAENQQCSRCDALEEECILLRTEIDFIKGEKGKFEEEIKKLNREIKDLGLEHLREKQTLQKEIHSMKEKQLKEEKSQLEKNQEEFAKMKKNLAREKKKLKEAKEDMAAETKAKTDAWNELAKLKNELSEKEKQKGEDIARKCDMLREEIPRLRSMSGRVLNYRKYFDRHGVIYTLGTNFGTTPWVNPSSTNAFPTRIIASRSSDEQGSASDLLDTRRGGTLSILVPKGRDPFGQHRGSRPLAGSNFRVRDSRTSGRSAQSQDFSKMADQSTNLSDRSLSRRARGVK